MFLKLSVKIKLLLLTIFFISIFNTVFAAKPVALSSGATVTCSDNPARINSQISIQVQFTSDEAGTNATVNFTGICNPGINTLNCNNIGGNVYLAQGTFAVVAGEKEDNANLNFTVTLINASGTTTTTTTPSINIDNKAPTRKAAMSCKVNNTAYATGQILKAEDKVVLTQTVTDSDVVSVLLDLFMLSIALIPSGVAAPFIPKMFALIFIET